MTRRGRSVVERREQNTSVDDPEIVLAAAARFLKARPRSVAEVRQRLTFNGYRATLVDGAIERLVDLGMLDDAEFARLWVESRDRARPRGERALRSELIEKGVDRAIIDALLAGRRDERMATEAGAAADAPSADEAAAIRLLERSRRSLERVSDVRARRQRAYALLARNGFDPDVCARVAAGFVAVADAEDDPREVM